MCVVECSKQATGDVIKALKQHFQFWFLNTWIVAPGIRLQHVSRAMVKSHYKVGYIGILWHLGSAARVTCLVTAGGGGWLMRPNCGVQQWSSPLNTAARVTGNWLQFITPHLVPHRFVPGPGPVVCITKQKGQTQEKKVAMAKANQLNTVQQTAKPLAVSYMQYKCIR